MTRPHEPDDILPDERPASAANFIVLIGDREIGFCRISRLSSEDGAATDPTAADRAPRSRYAPVVLTRALGRGRQLFDWRQEAVAGRDAKRRVTIRQLDPEGRETVNSWILEGAYPVRWTGPAFDAGAANLAFEEIEIVFDRLIWA